MSEADFINHTKMKHSLVFKPLADLGLQHLDNNDDIQVFIPSRVQAGQGSTKGD